MLANLCRPLFLPIFFFNLCFTVAHAEEKFSANIEPDASLIALPHIVVSIEPLYEIVSSLSHGVVKPEVIYRNFSDIKQALSTRQQEDLLTADIIIRVGKGFEPQLDEFLNGQGKALQNKTITLSNYIPLLDKDDKRADAPFMNFTDRQANSDLRFWMDPRLLRMLTDFIAPKLVDVDPEHIEEYLENEIVLRAQLKKVENKMVSLFQELSLEQKLLLGQLNPYLKNRYLSFIDIQSVKSNRTIHPNVISCLQNKSYDTIPLNLEYTEKTLNTLLYTIEECEKTTLVRSVY